MKSKQHQILENVLSLKGIPHQLDMVIEEAAELIQAINKAKRAKIVEPWGIKPPCKESLMEQVKAYNELCQEVADMKIMIAQLDLILDHERIEISMERKLNRLKERIENKQI